MTKGIRILSVIGKHFTSLNDFGDELLFYVTKFWLLTAPSVYFHVCLNHKHGFRVTDTNSRRSLEELWSDYVNTHLHSGFP